MNASPTFTEKHYKHLIAALRQVATPSERRIVADVLCRVFKQDNPKFKPELFTEQVTTGDNQ